jgi:transmembrane sensor
MTEHALQTPPQMPAQAMDEALDWLTVLASPTPAQCQAFDAWLARDPLHAAAYAKASAALSHAATNEATEARPLRAQARLHWASLAVAGLVMLGMAMYVWIAVR